MKLCHSSKMGKFGNHEQKRQQRMADFHRNRRKRRGHRGQRRGYVTFEKTYFRVGQWVKARLVPS